LIYRQTISSLADCYHLPTIYPFRIFVEDGGLSSYGIDLVDLFRGGKRRVRAAGSARQRRNEAGQRRKGMAVERPKIDGLGRTARRTAHPKEPMPCLESAADRRREQHWHALGLPLVPRSNDVALIAKSIIVARSSVSV
jgi:hypothetical protein